jgi:hypothetical protein
MLHTFYLGQSAEGAEEQSPGWKSERSELWGPRYPRVPALRAFTLGFVLPRFQRWIQDLAI